MAFLDVNLDKNLRITTYRKMRYLSAIITTFEKGCFHPFDYGSIGFLVWLCK